MQGYNKNLYNKLIKKLLIIFSIFLFIVSCSSINISNKRRMEINEYVNRDEVIRISRKEVFNLYNENILNENIAIYKKGLKADWNVILFGNEKIYNIIIDNLGDLLEINTIDYE